MALQARRSAHAPRASQPPSSRLCACALQSRGGSWRRATMTGARGRAGEGS